MNKREIRKLAVVLLTVSLGIPVINGCSMPQNDPTKQTIPTDSDQWQEKLGKTFEQLSESDRQLRAQDQHRGPRRPAQCAKGARAHLATLAA